MKKFLTVLALLAGVPVGGLLLFCAADVTYRNYRMNSGPLPTVSQLVAEHNRAHARARLEESAVISREAK